MKTLLPVNVQDLRQEDQWIDLIQEELAKLENCSIKIAKSKFLEYLQKWSLFGSTFFFIRVRTLEIL